MKLQLALDGPLNNSLDILHAVRSYIDIAEIGTPLIYREGMAAARCLRKTFSDLPLLADLKIMDAGDEEATIAFESGCDFVTVLGVTQDATLQSVVEAARRFGRQVMVDMMQVPNPVARARSLLTMGCDYLCIHTAHDLQYANASPLDGLRHLREALPDAPLAVAGGITVQTIEAVTALEPVIVVVGSAITRAINPARAARMIRERMHFTL